VESLTFVGRNCTLIGIEVTVQVAVFTSGTVSKLSLAFDVTPEMFLVCKSVGNTIF